VLSTSLERKTNQKNTNKMAQKSIFMPILEKHQKLDSNFKKSYPLVYYSFDLFLKALMPLLQFFKKLTDTGPDF